MENLRLELISTISEYFLDWGFADTPFAHLTETSGRRYGVWHGGWLLYTDESWRDICNFRRICRQLYTGSFVSFGGFLGSRVFRLTKLGMEDLQGILDVVLLRPHIRTLTFGSAQFYNSSDHPAVMKVFGLMSAPMQTKLPAAYADPAGW